MFKPGDKVICSNIDDKVYDDGSVSRHWDCLKLHETYTVSKVFVNSMSLVELTDLYAHPFWRFKTYSEIRKDKLNKIKNEHHK